MQLLQEITLENKGQIMKHIFMKSLVIGRHSNMINKFNNDCAGKQSRSSYEAAQKLNNG